MLGKIKTLKRLLTTTNKVVQQNQLINEDLFGLQLIQPFLKGTYLPITGGAIRPFAMAFLINDIIINNRKTIIEFGSGVSSIVIARMIKMNKIQSKIISFENDRGWYEHLTNLIHDEDLESQIELHYAPLGKSINGHFGAIKWYDTSTTLKDIQKIDLVIIDGPPSYTQELRHSRFPALYEIFNSLSDDYCIYLDDTNRVGEKQIIEQWEKDLSIKFEHPSQTYSIMSNKTHFNSIPYKFR